MPDIRHTVALGPEEWWSLDVGYHYRVARGWISAGAGVDHSDREWNDSSAVLGRAWVSWRQEFR